MVDYYYVSDTNRQKDRIRLTAYGTYDTEKSQKNLLDRTTKHPFFYGDKLKVCPISSFLGKTALIGGINTPKSLDIAPMSQDFTSMSKDIAPMSQDFTSMSKDIAPMSQDITPISQDFTPMSQDITPMSQDFTPMSQDFNSKSLDITPKSLKKPQIRGKNTPFKAHKEA
jgi:hypothetical protein